jgi:hypothetical protein
MGWCERHPLVSLRPDPNSNPDANPHLELESSRVSPPHTGREKMGSPTLQASSNSNNTIATANRGSWRSCARTLRTISDRDSDKQQMPVHFFALLGRSICEKGPTA